MNMHRKNKCLPLALLPLAILLTEHSTAATIILGDTTSPRIFTYKDSFTRPSSSEFTDWFVFSFNPTSYLDAKTISLKSGSIFGITNLQTKLYQGQLDANGAVQQGLLLAEAIVSTSGSANTTVQSISPLLVQGGRYLLKVSGRATGTLGGSYSGSLNLVPPGQVPVPSAVSLLGIGLAMIGFVFRGRRYLVKGQNENTLSAC